LSLLLLVNNVLFRRPPPRRFGDSDVKQYVRIPTVEQVEAAIAKSRESQAENWKKKPTIKFPLSSISQTYIEFHDKILAQDFVYVGPLLLDYHPDTDQFKSRLHKMRDAATLISILDTQAKTKTLIFKGDDGAVSCRVYPLDSIKNAQFFYTHSRVEREFVYFGTDMIGPYLAHVFVSTTSNNGVSLYYQDVFDSLPIMICRDDDLSTWTIRFDHSVFKTGPILGSMFDIPTEMECSHVNVIDDDWIPNINDSYLEIIRGLIIMNSRS